MTHSAGTVARSSGSHRELSSERESSRAWQFLGTLAIVRNPIGAPRTPAVIELVIPPGGSPPRHMHDTLDDSFLLLDGEVVVRCGDETIIGRAGSYISMPAKVDHTFRVTSTRPARMLLVHGDDSFLSFIEAVGAPATDLHVPSDSQPDLDFDTIARLSAQHGSPFVGPSLDDAEARSFLTPGRPVLGPVHHLSVAVTDLPRSEQWYCHAFDLVRVDGDIDAEGNGHVVLSSSGGWLLSLASAQQAHVDHIAIGCAELARCRDQLAARGIEPGTITDALYGSGFVLRDPDGIELELFAPPG